MIARQPGTPVDRNDPAVRKRLSGPGLRTFFSIAEKWGLSVDQQRTLLGAIPASTYYKWRANALARSAVTPSHDQLERVSLVLGIYQALRVLFAEDTSGLRWLVAENTDVPFDGRSPLGRMLRGSIDDLYAVRRYVDAWRGSWP